MYEEASGAHDLFWPTEREAALTQEPPSAVGLEGETGSLKSIQFR